MKRSPLLDELKLNRDFDPPEEELFFNIIKTYEYLHDEISVFFKQYGLSENQYNVLRIVSGAGAAGLPCQQIAKRLIYRLPDVTRLVNRLIDKNLVQRQQDSNDKRVFIIKATQEGRELVAKSKQPLKKMMSDLFKPIKVEQQKQINLCLYKLRCK